MPSLVRTSHVRARPHGARSRPRCAVRAGRGAAGAPGARGTAQRTRGSMPLPAQAACRSRTCCSPANGRAPSAVASTLAELAGKLRARRPGAALGAGAAGRAAGGRGCGGRGRRGGGGRWQGGCGSHDGRGAARHAASPACSRWAASRRARCLEPVALGAAAGAATAARRGLVAPRVPVAASTSVLAMARKWRGRAARRCRAAPPPLAAAARRARTARPLTN